MCVILYVENQYSLWFIITQVFLYWNCRYKLKISKQSKSQVWLKLKPCVFMKNYNAHWQTIHSLHPSRDWLPLCSSNRNVCQWRALRRRCEALPLTCDVDRYTSVWCRKICQKSRFINKWHGQSLSVRFDGPYRLLIKQNFQRSVLRKYLDKCLLHWLSRFLFVNLTMNYVHNSIIVRSAPFSVLVLLSPCEIIKFRRVYL